MDFITITIWILAVLFGAFGGSFICTLLLTGYGVAQLEKRIKSLEMGNLSQKGIIAREELQNEEAEVMMKGAAILKDDEIPQNEKMKHLISLGMQHPKIATKLIKKFGFGDLNSLI
jgi:hypothetical protein